MGVDGAKNFFEAKVSDSTCEKCQVSMIRALQEFSLILFAFLILQIEQLKVQSKFEMEVKKEQEEKRKQELEKKQKRQEFAQKHAFFEQVTLTQ